MAPLDALPHVWHALFMTETTRTGIAVSMWIIATLLGILCLFVTGTLPWVSAIFYVICTLALAEYLRTSPR